MTVNEEGKSSTSGIPNPNYKSFLKSCSRLAVVQLDQIDEPIYESLMYLRVTIMGPTSSPVYFRTQEQFEREAKR